MLKPCPRMRLPYSPSRPRAASSTPFAAGDSSVGEPVDALAINQPSVSRHLKVLREAGFVSCRTAAQHRIYRIETCPFRALDEWLQPHRDLWSRHLDALERHLDRQINDEPAIQEEHR
jgi:DNA-binding transcriptional ArsR family regulator